MNKRIQGTIEVGIPLFMIAILGGVTLTNYWTDIAMWIRVTSIVLILITAIAGFSMLGRPGGMGSMHDE